MRSKIPSLLLVLSCMMGAGPLASAQSTRIQTPCAGSLKLGSAFGLSLPHPQGRLYVTAAHNLEGAIAPPVVDVQVAAGQVQRVPVSLLGVDPHQDIAVLLCPVPGELAGFQLLTDDPPTGTAIELLGFPGDTQIVHKQVCQILGTVQDEAGFDGLNCDGWTTFGASGGPALYRGQVCGVICRARVTERGVSVARSVYVQRVLQRVCPQCMPPPAPQYWVQPNPPGASTPYRVQPLLPPSSAAPNPVAPRLLPVPDPLFSPVGPDPGLAGSAALIGPTGPRGFTGPAGPAGPGPTATELQAAVAAYLASHPAPNNEAALRAELDRIRSELAQRSQRVLIVAGTQVLDDETYTNGEPIVIDLKRVAAQAP